MNSYLSPWLRRMLWLLFIALAVTGMSQMPIFKRYYIADIPGLGWLAAYYTTHKIHYVAAALFLAIMGWLAADHLLIRRREWRLTGFGWLRLALLAVIIATGMLRTVKNLPDHGFGPMVVMTLDWTHLFGAVLLGLVAVAARSGPWKRQGVYAVRR